MHLFEPLESRTLLAATFSVNSVRRLYSEPIGGEASGSRVIRYKNVSNHNVTIGEGGVIVGGAHASQYQIISSYTLPRGLRPGASVKFSLVFNPPTGTTAGIKSGLFTVITTGGLSKTVRLRGIATTGLGGANEPSLQRIFDLYQMPIHVGDNDPATDALNQPTLTPNDSLAVSTMTKAGPGDVIVYPIAAYIQQINPSLYFGYYTQSNGSDLHELFTLAHTDAQSVNPFANGSITFDPGSSSFGLYATYPGEARTVYTTPSLNSFESNASFKRKAYFYPLKSKDGTVTPNAYVVGFEDLTAAIGVDFQDGVFVIQNVKKAS